MPFIRISFISALYFFGFIFIVKSQELPFCSEPQTGAILVSTLDGKFSRLTPEGVLKWQIDTEPGPLLTSNIHNLELTNNGQWIRIIPSLTGVLYKFDGYSIYPLALTAESLLKSSFKYSDDLVMAGSIEVKNYGLGFRSGKLSYECSSSVCTNNTEELDKDDDILILRRSTQTVRAIELRTGVEKWNFSVGDIDIKLPQASCIDLTAKRRQWNVTAVLPDGVIQVTQILDSIATSWHYKFTSPIVKIWKWSGFDLQEIDLFSLKTGPESSISPAIYVGMHNRQLYIHESVSMANMLEDSKYFKTGLIKSDSLSKIPWKPIPASERDIEEDSTALAVLYGSQYFNGNGYFLFTEKDIKLKDTQLCEKNQTIKYITDKVQAFIPLSYWWKEITVIAITTAIFFHLLFRYSQTRKQKEVTKSLEEPEVINKTTEIVPLENPATPFSSRYLNDFETLQCLGKGGYGVVFQVKQKFDECEYAVKRISLPRQKPKRDRVMKEVKILAKLEHQNIVRYFNSWVEHPPKGWQQSHDNNWIGDATSDLTTTHSIFHKRSQSISILMDTTEQTSLGFDEAESDDFICFENSSNNNVSNSTQILSKKESSTHLEKKKLWKRPSRKSYSLDMTRRVLEPPIFLYIQMQLCQKESLRDWLLKHQKREKYVILDIFKQIVSAVEYVHMQGLIHRDLKPGNIFFSLEGQIKVGDFGLVKDMEGSFDLETNINSSSFMSNESRQVGTLLYMSPEQLRNEKYDYKVDIYSLGLIFFELLYPFSTDMHRYQILKNIKTNHYPKDFVDEHKEEHALLSSMLSTDPKKRLTTIGIRAKPPLNDKDPNYDEKYFYEMPKSTKTKVFS